jgi:hypothetical protein
VHGGESGGHGPGLGHHETFSTTPATEGAHLHSLPFALAHVTSAHATLALPSIAHIAHLLLALLLLQLLLHRHLLLLLHEHLLLLLLKHVLLKLLLQLLLECLLLALLLLALLNDVLLLLHHLLLLLLGHLLLLLLLLLVLGLHHLLHLRLSAEQIRRTSLLPHGLFLINASWSALVGRHLLRWQGWLVLVEPTGHVLRGHLLWRQSWLVLVVLPKLGGHLILRRQSSLCCVNARRSTLRCLNRRFAHAWALLILHEICSFAPQCWLVHAHAMLLLHPFTIALHSATPTSKGLIAAAPKAALLPHGAHVLLTLVGEWLGPCACSTLSVCPTSRASTLAKRRPAWGRSATRAMVGLLTISLLLAISTLASNTRRSALATGLAACTVTTGLRLATVSTRPVAGLTAEARLGPKPTWTTLSAALWLRAVRHLVARVVEAAQWVTVTSVATTDIVPIPSVLLSLLLPTELVSIIAPCPIASLRALLGGGGGGAASLRTIATAEGLLLTVAAAIGTVSGLLSTIATSSVREGRRGRLLC